MGMHLPIVILKLGPLPASPLHRGIRGGPLLFSSHSSYATRRSCIPFCGGRISTTLQFGWEIPSTIPPVPLPPRRSVRSNCLASSGSSACRPPADSQDRDCFALSRLDPATTSTPNFLEKRLEREPKDLVSLCASPPLHDIRLYLPSCPSPGRSSGVCIAQPGSPASPRLPVPSFRPPRCLFAPAKPPITWPFVRRPRHITDSWPRPPRLPTTPRILSDSSRDSPLLSQTALAVHAAADQEKPCRLVRTFAPSPTL